MKTAISIPDRVFDQAEKFARHRNLSRSALFTAAVTEYLDTHSREDVTAKLNAVYAQEDSSLDPTLTQIQNQSVDTEDWS